MFGAIALGTSHNGGKGLLLVLGIGQGQDAASGSKVPQAPDLGATISVGYVQIELDDLGAQWGTLFLSLRIILCHNDALDLWLGGQRLTQGRTNQSVVIDN